MNQRLSDFAESVVYNSDCINITLLRENLADHDDEEIRQGAEEIVRLVKKYAKQEGVELEFSTRRRN